MTSHPFSIPGLLQLSLAVNGLLCLSSAADAAEFKFAFGPAEVPPGFTHAMLLREGTVVASGLLGETMTADNLSKTFGQPLVVQRSGDRYTARAELAGSASLRGRSPDTPVR